MRWVLFTLMLLAGRSVLATTCSAPTTPRLLFPGPGQRVPRDVVLYLEPGPQKPRLALVETGGGREIWLRTERLASSLRLSPTRLLEAERGYELRQLGELRSKPPRVLGTFRTTNRTHRQGPSAFTRASMMFSAVKPLTMTQRPGRAADVALEAGPEPAAVEILLAFHTRRGWSATWRRVLPYARRLRVAATHACDPAPTAPARGQYRMTLIPWGPTGEKGRELQLKGVIR